MENTAASPVIYIVEVSADPFDNFYEFYSAYSTLEGAEDRVARLKKIGETAIVTTAVLN